MARLVVDGVAAESGECLVGVGVVVLGIGVGLVDAFGVFEFHCVDETGHGDVFALHPGGIDWFGLVSCRFLVEGHLLFIFLLVELLVVFLGSALGGFLGFLGLVFLGRSHGKLLRLDFLFGHGHLAAEAKTVAVGIEDGQVVVAIPVLLQHGGNFVFAVFFPESFGVGDVIVVDDAAILSLFHVVGR